MYIVHLPARNCWRTFLQGDLDSEGGFDPETAHLGTRPEISFDIVLKEENAFAEGSYRLPGQFWQVVIFQKDDVPEVRCQPSKWDRPTNWEREATGIVLRFPRTAKLSRDDLLQAMSQAFGCNEWTVVHGPDSMNLR
jgi:hypothetical protein